MSIIEMTKLETVKNERPLPPASSQRDRKGGDSKFQLILIPGMLLVPVSALVFAGSILVPEFQDKKGLNSQIVNELSLIEQERVANPTLDLRSETIALKQSASGQTAILTIPAIFADEELPTVEALIETIIYKKP